MSSNETPTVIDLKRSGGRWLGAAREWLQWNTVNGDRATWGSDDAVQPQLTVRDIEDLAAHVAVAAIEEDQSRV